MQISPASGVPGIFSNSFPDEFAPRRNNARASYSMEIARRSYYRGIRGGQKKEQFPLSMHRSRGRKISYEPTIGVIPPPNGTRNIARRSSQSRPAIRKRDGIVKIQLTRQFLRLFVRLSLLRFGKLSLLANLCKVSFKRLPCTRGGRGFRVSREAASNHQVPAIFRYDNCGIPGRVDERREKERDVTRDSNMETSSLRGTTDRGRVEKK